MKSKLTRTLIAVCLVSLSIGMIGCSKSEDTTTDTAKPTTANTSGTPKPPVAGGAQRSVRDVTQ